jgi:hypothetical protein
MIACKLSNVFVAGAVALIVAAAAGCGGRPDGWGEPVGNPAVFGLGSSVAVVDAPTQRVVAFTVDGQRNLMATRLPTGHTVLATSAQPGGDRLYVLTAGVQPGLGDTRAFEAPSLTVVKDGAPPTAETIDLGSKLTDPLSGLAVDPGDNWAVLYAGPDSGNPFVTNPNELVIVDLATPEKALHTVSLHSFGGSPEALMFTPELGLPGGAGHLLIVQSQQDLALLRLEQPETPEITVRLADATTVTLPKPAQVVVDDGDPQRDDDARIGIRFEGQTSVMTLQLVPATDGSAQGFSPTVNVADVGGVPSDIAFVRTDGGLRLAALVPARSTAVLLDPVTTITTEVALPAPYQRMSLVTGSQPGGSATGTAANPAADVALLWQGTGAGTGVAFWELGQAAGTPFRSIETVGVNAAVSGVLDVPLPGAELKVLSTAGASAFYVLDLETRTAAPLVTTTSQISLSMSPNGQRVWTFTPRGMQLASTDLSNEHARTLHPESEVDGAFEIANSDGSGRSLVALHESGALGATIYDAQNASDADRRIYGGLLLEGPY